MIYILVTTVTKMGENGNCKYHLPTLENCGELSACVPYGNNEYTFKGINSKYTLKGIFTNNKIRI